ncbi:hypothetical protein [Rhodocaloribacter sp.]
MTRPVTRTYIRFIPLLFALVLGACQSKTGALGLSADEIIANPTKYAGKTVTLSGEVDKVFDPRIFTVGGHGFRGDLLVISLDAIAAAPGRTVEVPLQKNDLVLVTGRVEPFSAEGLERKYNLQLDPVLVGLFKNRPVVVIGESVAATLPPVVVTPRSAPEAPTATTPLTNLAEVAMSPNQEAYIDRVAFFRHVPVDEVVAKNAFWIGSKETGRLFVVLTMPEEYRKKLDIKEGDLWTFYGIIRELPGPGLLKTSWKLPDEAVADLSAEDVYLQALNVEAPPRR